MERRFYYVSVQGRWLQEHPATSAYEWIVSATLEEAEQLGRWLGRIGEEEENGFLGFTYPWPDSPEAEVNRSYHRHLSQVYQEIYNLGTEETRAQMEYSGLIQAFREGNNSTKEGKEDVLH